MSNTEKPKAVISKEEMEAEDRQKEILTAEANYMRMRLFKEVSKAIKPFTRQVHNGKTQRKMRKAIIKVLSKYFKADAIEKMVENFMTQISAEILKRDETIKKHMEERKQTEARLAELNKGQETKQ